ncbi:MAG: hypothetical protein AAFR73_07245 [Pseudomonadota bacterium]
MKQYLTPAVRRGSVIFATVAAALLSGHVVQRDTVEDLPTVTPAVEVPELPVSVAELKLPPFFSNRILETRVERKASCDPSLELSETPIGFLHVVVTAPCRADTRLRVQFNDLDAEVALDGQGRWEQRFPPLTSNLRVLAQTGPYQLRRDVTLKQDAKHQHVVLAWSGAQTFHIRADTLLHFTGKGAPEAGNEPHKAAVSTRVGDGKGSSFEILTFPVSAQGISGIVRLSVDARVTEANCDRSVATTAFQTGYLGTLRPTEIAYTMPACDRVGEIVRLQNLFRDMRLAAR